MASDSIVFPVHLDAARVLELDGRTWFRRPEFHVTTFTPDDLAAATGIDEDVLADAGERHRVALEAVRPIRFDGRVAHVRAGDGRETLVAFCAVEGLPAVFDRLAAAVGRALPYPPTHVTLYTILPGMKGIGLATDAAVAARATPLGPAAAATVLGSLRRFAGA